MVARILPAALAALVLSQSALADEESVERRSPFPIPLAKLGVVFDEVDLSFVKVRVKLGDSPDMWDIGRGDDALIKFARGGKETLLHREMESMAHLISPFEADMLNRVTEGLVRTLRILEKDVQRRRADRLRYLDSYLPRFLRGYYYLYCAARNSSAALPDRAAIPETAYEVSLNSTVSDQRVATWLDNPQQALRVRLSALELSYQLHQWQHGELEAAGNARPPSGPANKVEEAFTLFVRAYFNRMPPPVPPANGKHL